MTSPLLFKGAITENAAWHPWFTPQTPSMPAGYVTTYNVTGAAAHDFTFLTIRLAGHMVRMFTEHQLCCAVLCCVFGKHTTSWPVSPPSIACELPVLAHVCST